MKEQELRKHATCNVCRNPIGASGLPLFYTVEIARYGVKLDAVRRQDGLGAMLGNSRLAQVMGPDEEMTETVMEPVKITVCENCSMTDQLIAHLAELGGSV